MKRDRVARGPVAPCLRYLLNPADCFPPAFSPPSNRPLFFHVPLMIVRSCRSLSPVMTRLTEHEASSLLQVKQARLKAQKETEIAQENSHKPFSHDMLQHLQRVTMPPFYFKANMSKAGDQLLKQLQNQSRSKERGEKERTSIYTNHLGSWVIERLCDK